MGGITNGEGEQELMGVGANAGVLIEEDSGEVPTQVNNTGTTYVAVLRYVTSSSEVKLAV